SDLELPAQPADSHVDRAVEWIGTAPARPVEELVAREHAAWPLDEAGEQVELGRGQGHARSVGALDAARIEIDDEAAEAAPAPLTGTRSGYLRASQDGADARQQLARVERLAQIVVGAELEPDDTVDVVVLGSEHQDRRRTTRAQTPADRQAVLARQHQIENDEVRRHTGERAVGASTVLGHLDGESLALEEIGEQRANVTIVLDDQDDLAVHATNLDTAAE